MIFNVNNFKTKKDRTKKVLLLIGPIGCGKTCIAQLLFKKFDYKIIEGQLKALQKLKFPITETDSALGAQTAK